MNKIKFFELRSVEALTSDRSWRLGAAHSRRKTRLVVHRLRLDSYWLMLRCNLNRLYVYGSGLDGDGLGLYVYGLWGHVVAVLFMREGVTL